MTESFSAGFKEFTGLFCTTIGISVVVVISRMGFSINFYASFLKCLIGHFIVLTKSIWHFVTHSAQVSYDTSYTKRTRKIDYYCIKEGVALGKISINNL